jgi:hypothetical protein
LDRDVFISHATGDAACGAAICRSLEAGGLKCWMAPRDILPGTDYSAAVVNAIERCRAVVLLLSRHANDSRWVHREVERAISRGKPVLTVRLEAIAPGEMLELLVSSSQWYDVFGLKPATYLSELGKKVQLLVRENPAAPSAPPVAPPPPAAVPPSAAAPALPAAPAGAPVAGARSSLSRQPGTWLAAGCSLLVLVAVVVVRMLLSEPPEPATPVAADRPEAVKSELMASFESLQAHLEKSMGEQQRCSWWDDPDVSGLKILAAQAPPAEALTMARKLDELKSTCDAVDQGGDQARDALSELDRKHQGEAVESGSTGGRARAAHGGH